MATIKNPTTISLDWWKKTVPDSLPKSKKIEDLLKLCEIDLRTLPKIFRLQIEKAKGVELKDIESALDSIFPPFEKLLEELKRFSVTVTKAKHADFEKALAVLILIVRDAKKAALNIKASTVNEATANKSSKSTLNPNQVKLIETALDGYGSSLTKINSSLGVMGKSLDTAKSKADFEKIIGQNRFLQAAIKKMRADIKDTMKRYGDALKDKSNAKLAARIMSTARLMETVKGGIDKLDKLALVSAVKILGASDGKKLFMAAKPVLLNIK